MILFDMDWIRPIVAIAVPTIILLIWMSKWFGKHNEWAKGMDEFKRETKATLVEIRDDIKKVLTALPPSVIRGASPMRLTDLGKKVSEYVEAAAWAEQSAPQLAGKVNGMNAYDIQEFCIAYMRNEHRPTTAQNDLFKKCAFDHGIKLDQVLAVCAVELRDRSLHITRSEDTDRTS